MSAFAKWKPLAKGVAQADVYQMMAYARLYRCPHMLLIYPAAYGKGGKLVATRALANGPERLDIATLSLSCGPDAVREQLGNIVSEAL